MWPCFIAAFRRGRPDIFSSLFFSSVLRSSNLRLPREGSDRDPSLCSLLAPANVSFSADCQFFPRLFFYRRFFLKPFFFTTVFFLFSISFLGPLLRSRSLSLSQTPTVFPEFIRVRLFFLATFSPAQNCLLDRHKTTHRN